MIRINKPGEIPPKLIEYQESLNEAIQEYGTINNIPEEKKEKLLNGYKHDDVRNSLFNCSHQKCAYCETKSYGGYLEVEHFAPKKLYPELSLDWDNLIPSCRVCNNSKSIYDTVSDPIINPCKIDPEPYFDYEFLSINPSENAPDYNLAEKTIQVCKLNRIKLVRARIKILVELTNYEKQIKTWIKKINESDSNRKTNIRIQNLIDSIEAIEDCANETEQYSGLCRYFLKKSRPFNGGKEILRISRN